MLVGLQLLSKEFQHLAIQTKIEQHFGGLFHQIKVRPTGRQDSMQNIYPNKQEVGFFMHEAAQNYEVFSNNQV